MINNLKILYMSLEKLGSAYSQRVLKLAESEGKPALEDDIWSIPSEESVYSDESVSQYSPEYRNRIKLEEILRSDIIPEFESWVENSAVPMIYNSESGASFRAAEIYGLDPSVFAEEAKDFADSMIIEYSWGPEDPMYEEGSWGVYEGHINKIGIQMHKYLEHMSEGGLFYNNDDFLKAHIIDTLKHELVHNFDKSPDIIRNRPAGASLSEKSERYMSIMHDKMISNFDYFLSKVYSLRFPGKTNDELSQIIESNPKGITDMHKGLQEDTIEYWKDIGHVWLNLVLLRIHISSENDGIDYGSIDELEYICSLNYEELIELGLKFGDKNRYLWFVLGLKCGRAESLKGFYEKIVSNESSEKMTEYS